MEKSFLSKNKHGKGRKRSSKKGVRMHLTRPLPLEVFLVNPLSSRWSNQVEYQYPRPPSSSLVSEPVNSSFLKLGQTTFDYALGLDPCSRSSTDPLLDSYLRTQTISSASLGPYPRVIAFTLTNLGSSPSLKALCLDLEANVTKKKKKNNSSRHGWSHPHEPSSSRLGHLAPLLVWPSRATSTSN